MFVTQIVKANECDGLVAELQTMKKAQNQIITSLANNHETFAVTIEEMAAPLKEKSIIPDRANIAINESADVFRRRGIQAKKISQKLEDATEDLIKRIAICLKK